MLYSKLLIDTTLYICLHAEQVFQNFKVFGNNTGIFEHELSLEPIEAISKYFKEEQDTCEHVVIDCFDLDSAVNVGVEFFELVKLISDKAKFTAIRIGVRLFNDLKVNLLKTHFGNQLIEKYENEQFSISIDCDPIDSSKFDDVIQDNYKKKFKSILKENFLDDNPKKYSDSSNVYLPKYINIKKFIEEKELLYFGLYLLCKNGIAEGLLPKLEERGKIFNDDEELVETKTPILFYQSLNGSYIASILSKLLVVDLAYIDHIGPINKIYQTVLKTNFRMDNEYLIVSDVICMGTEIQIAKSLIEYNKSIPKGNMTIVKVEVIKGKDEIPVSSLFTLTSKENTEIGYQINTELI